MPRSIRSPANRKIRSAGSGNHPTVAEPLRHPTNWLSLIGVDRHHHRLRPFDSGDERRGNAGPGLSRGGIAEAAEFQEGGFIVFAYSLLLTGSTNFLAVLLIPDDERLKQYYDNWIGGLAMHMVGPVWLLLLLERVCRVRRLFDSLRRGEHFDRRLQRRAEPRGRRWRAARLVSEAAPHATAPTIACCT